MGAEEFSHSFDLEGVLAREGKDLGRRDVVTLRENDKLSLVVAISRVTLPLELDWVERGVDHAEVLDTEYG